MLLKRTLILLLLCVVTNNLIGQKSEIDLKEAIDSGLVECKVYGSWNGKELVSNDANGQYFGKCMTIEVLNVSEDSLNIYIDYGQMLICNDSMTQDMIITKPLLVGIRKNKKETIEVYAMCAEINDAVPFRDKEYSIGQLADESLVKIVKSIDDMFMQNICGQNAVWAYTDDTNEHDFRSYGASNSSLKNTKLILEEAQVETGFYQLKPKEIIENNTVDNKKVLNEISFITWGTYIMSFLSFIGFIIFLFKYLKLKSTIKT